MNSSLDYYSLDQEDESTLNRLIQEQLGRGRVRRRERPKATVPERAPQLPSGMLGSGQLLASQLLSIAKKCGEDKRCWLSELQARKK